MAKEKDKSKKDIKTPSQIKKSNQKRVFKFFKMWRGKDENKKDLTVFPAKVKEEEDSDDFVLSKLKLISDLEKNYKYFLENHSRLENLRNRQNRNRELFFMVYNNEYMFRAHQIYTDETLNTSEQVSPIKITAKNKAREKHFYNWMEDIGANSQILSDAGSSMNLYGDGFWVNAVDMVLGVTEITPVDVYTVVDRLEFNATKIEEYQAKRGLLSNLKSRVEVLRDITSEIDDAIKSKDYADMYKSYLLGFQLAGGKSVPPWCVTHFRRYSSASEFFPWGRSLFLGSLPLYKSYATSLLLKDVAEASAFPKEVYEIEGGEDLTPAEVYKKVEKTRQMIENVTSKNEKKDALTISEPIYTVKGLFNYKQESNNLDPSKLTAVDQKRTSLFQSVGLPESILLGTNPSWGASGQSLISQNKLVARRVWLTQIGILQSLTELYQIHLEITEENPDTDWILEIAIPQLEMSRDRIGIENDSLRFAKDLLTALGELSGLDTRNGEVLPIEISRDILNQYTTVPEYLINDWAKTVSKEEVITEAKQKKIKEKIKKRPITETVFKECYFTTLKENRVNSGVFGGKIMHAGYYSTKEHKKVLGMLKQEKVNIKATPKLKD